MGLSAVADRGWCRFPVDVRTLTWARAARHVARRVLDDPEMRAKWLQCQGTWFVGVDAMPSKRDGSVDGVPLAGIGPEALVPLPPLHPAQLSVVFPGYPKPRDGESATAFGYRCNRDAAHVDGILAEGAERRRYVREPHAWILGLPLTEADKGASPLVVWEGSHDIMRTALRDALSRDKRRDWHNVDVTEAYQAARRHCFENCRRVALTARPGEALLVHRLTLHGIAPWEEGASAPPEGRMTAYFRPQMRGGVAAWLQP